MKETSSRLAESAAHDRYLAAKLESSRVAVCRQTARELIEQRVWSLRQQANSLEELSRALPLELPASADVALWQLVMNQK